MKTSLMAFAVASLFAAATPARASSYETLFTFNSLAQGDQPDGLVVAPGGRIYGFTSSGGAGDQGVAFSLTSPPVAGQRWSETVLFNFSASTAGGGSPAFPVLDAAGRLYGATRLSTSPPLTGSLFRLVPPSAPGGTWTQEVLYDLAAASHLPVHAVTSLTIGPGGVLYGVCINPAAAEGEVYSSLCSFTPPASGAGRWTPTLLRTATLVAGKEAAFASTLLLRIIDGRVALFGLRRPVYGTSQVSYELYRLDQPASGGTDWRYVPLYVFPQGESPSGDLAVDRDLVFYGTLLSSHPGIAGAYDTVVYKLAPPGAGSGQYLRTDLRTFAASAGEQYYYTNGLAEDAHGQLFTLAYPETSTDVTLTRLTPRGGGVLPWNLYPEHIFSGTSHFPLDLSKSGGAALYGWTLGAAEGSRNDSAIFRFTP